MKYLNLLFLILSISIFVSCKKEIDNSPEDLGFFTIREARDYLYFKPDTWWEYKNSRTGLLDTILVIHSSLDTVELISDKLHFKEELFTVQSKSLNTGHEYYFYRRYEMSDYGKPSGWILTYLQSSAGGNTEPFYYPFNIYSKGDTSKHCIFLNKRDTMIINNIVFKDVAIFLIRGDKTEPYPMKGRAAKYYWAPKYGLIQKDLFDSKYLGDTNILFHSWKLINSNIVQ